MPMLKIYRYISTLLISLAAASASAQAPVTETAKTATQQVVKQTTALADTLKKEKKTPFISGAAVSVDMCGLIMKAMGSRFSNMEASARLNFKEKYFPIFELGLGDCTREGEENNNKFTTTAPYFRVGMDYNVFYLKPYLPGYFTVGVRYGFSSFKYDVQAPPLTDPNWGGTTVPVSYSGVKTNAGWGELVAGIKALVFKDFYMGFSVRYRVRMNMTKHENSEPDYIPGYGKGKKTGFGVTYNFVYKLPF